MSEESNLAGGLIKEFEKTVFICENLHAPRTESHPLSLASNFCRLQGRQDFPAPEDEGLSDGKTRFNS